MRATLFHNPTAGKKGHGKDDILAALKLAGHTARYVSTKSDRFKSELDKVSGDFVVVAGGDGTVAEVIARIGDRKLPIGVLPLGTANNIARSLAIAGEPQILVETWNMARTRRLDIGRADGPPKIACFVEAFGVGIVPQMLIVARKKDKEKGAHNLKQGRELLRKVVKDAKVIRLDIMVDGKKVEGEWLGAEVLNIPYTGPGLPLAPKADFNDGMLDLICFDKKNRDELCGWLETPADKPPPGTVRRGRTVTLSWRDAPYRIDDEAIKAEDRSRTFTITCDGEPATILESPLSAENDSRQRLQAVK
jgi:diacylglycerol kinase (ATP)